MSKKEKLAPVDLCNLATLVRRTIYNAYCATMVGNPAKVTSMYYDRASKPEIGDLVIESTTVHGMRHANATDLDGVGILEEIALEPFVFEGDPDFVWDEQVEGRPHPTERVYYIRTFDGRKFRWVNARMVAAVGIDLDFFGLHSSPMSAEPDEKNEHET